MARRCRCRLSASAVIPVLAKARAEQGASRLPRRGPLAMPRSVAALRALVRSRAARLRSWPGVAPRGRKASTRVQGPADRGPFVGEVLEKLETLVDPVDTHLATVRRGEIDPPGDGVDGAAPRLGSHAVEQQGNGKTSRSTTEAAGRGQPRRPGRVLGRRPGVLRTATGRRGRRKSVISWRTPSSKTATSSGVRSRTRAPSVSRTTKSIVTSAAGGAAGSRALAPGAWGRAGATASNRTTEWRRGSWPDRIPRLRAGQRERVADPPRTGDHRRAERPGGHRPGSSHS